MLVDTLNSEDQDWDCFAEDMIHTFAINDQKAKCFIKYVAFNLSQIDADGDEKYRKEIGLPIVSFNAHLLADVVMDEWEELEKRL